MKVVLLEAVQGLGEAGTIKEVADGYARNYLLPKKLAVLASRTAMKQAEAQAQFSARKSNKALTEAQKAAAEIEGKTVTIHARSGSENRLYGSVTSADVAEALVSQYSIEIDRRKVTIPETIHRLGTYTATADLGSGVSAQFNVEVAPEVSGATGKATKGTQATQATADKTAQADQSEQGTPGDAEAATPSDREAQAPQDDAAMDAGESGLQNDAAIELEAEANPT
ncbi:MAG: 50S ribosomal protein L9 [Chloroflexi bacterium]|nr:50S ribosomal protein L9 [Chloroflexota bacterium]